MTAVVCCWDFTSVVRANSLHVRLTNPFSLLLPHPCLIQEYASLMTLLRFSIRTLGYEKQCKKSDICLNVSSLTNSSSLVFKFRKNGVSVFPTTCEYELRVGSNIKSAYTSYSVKSSLLQISGSPGLYSSPLVTSFSSLHEVCNSECVNSIVSVGAIIVQLGEVKHSQGVSGSTYRTHRLWDPSLASSNIKEYVNLTLWDSNGECFDNAQIGDSLVAERVKVISFRSTFQLSSASFSLYHFNVNLPQAESMRQQWRGQQSNTLLTLDPASLPSLHRKPPIHPRSDASNHVEEPLSRGMKTKSNRKSKKKDSLITDFFQPALLAQQQDSQDNYYSQESLTSVPIASSSCSNDHSKSLSLGWGPTVQVHGRFSVADALKLEDQQSCWTVACLSDLLARSPRGWCVFNCMACGKAVSDCICVSSLHSPTWTLYVTSWISCGVSYLLTVLASSDLSAEWKDAENTVIVDIDNCLASQILQVPAAIFVGCNETQRQSCVLKALGKTFKILFEKVCNWPLFLKHHLANRLHSDSTPVCM